MYWSENLKTSSFSNCDDSIIGLSVFELCLINVYLTYSSRANTGEFLAYMGKMTIMPGAAMSKYLFCGGLQWWGHKCIWLFIRRLWYRKMFFHF